MRSRLHVTSLAVGMLGGVGLTLLVGAAVAPGAAAGPGRPVGRYELRATSSNNTSVGFVVDTVTGEVIVVPEHNAGNVIKPQWAQ
jgi:hypothetical protein